MQETIVVKCGGNAAVDPLAVCEDIAGLTRERRPVVLVHGGSADIEGLAARMGVASRRLTAPDGVSARYTDAETLQVVHLALAGLAKPRLLTALASAGVSAVGLTGLDGGLLRARRKTAHRAVVDGRRIVIRDDHSGRITEVNDALLRTLLAAGHVPVVSPPAVAEDGRPVNTDADRAAAAVAAGLGAGTLVLLTGAPGVLADPADEDSVLPVCAVAPSGTPPFTGGGMGLKLVAAREALQGGVGRVLIADGRRRDPVRAALAGSATEVVLEGGPAVAAPDAAIGAGR
ncbi:acetylglutamate kinase [Streptomyces eurocidicus]|uniref:Acetylglutamate kinase n=1 Tax=Streptomyces eurocidicus TaxID=66423 RepID=A0A2N8NVR6_STREU|nr:[LysW]-aminoadipate kinase [Streptomyces eurocidicus]MBB5120360.1 acetylglutamate/LysW-gamma-L-alpha-aminoadipate kinase [Streptomyces eurocidicus]MBF6055968.1 [LysW]-aminoadipate kinase [Streptomyces eurocidicus]PNE32854.1 acetylglutamate kinase [Streptomyces eurocidicus]